jgi:hypothetical protein
MMSGRANLTVMLLAGLISDPNLRVQVHSAAEQAQKTSEFARLWRNRWLAHMDLITLRNGPASSLPSVESQHVKDALESLRSLLESVENRYGLSPFPPPPTNPWGAGSLVEYLEKARLSM